MMKKKEGLSRTAFIVAAFVAVLVVFLVSVNYASKGNIDRQRQSLEKALQRDITDCYATTGRYPKTLDYIERVYGLTYDKEIFTVEYTVRGSKIPPEFTVVQTGGR